jgi:hypothetical protein
VSTEEQLATAAIAVNARRYVAKERGFDIEEQRKPTSPLSGYLR